MSYIKNIAIGIDQLANAIIGGWPDETFSSRAWRSRANSKLWAFTQGFIDGFLWFDPDHCRTSFESERLRLQSPPEER